MTAKNGGVVKVFAFTALGLSGLMFGFVILFESFTSVKCANSLSCEESFTFYFDNNETGSFNGMSVDPPDIEIADSLTEKRVLGTTDTMSDKSVYVDLGNQTLRAFEGTELFMEAKISSGKWNPTPEGEFLIWKKIRATKMEGGEGEGYYYLPNVPYVMFFSNSKVAPGLGYALHGAYWHNNFGHAMSHGCVNMRIIDAKRLYDWVGPEAFGNDTNSSDGNPGTKIIIYGQAP